MNVTMISFLNHKDYNILLDVLQSLDLDYRELGNFTVGIICKPL